MKLPSVHLNLEEKMKIKHGVNTEMPNYRCGLIATKCIP